MRSAARRAGKALAVLAIGYGGYTAAVQYETHRQIDQREKLVDITQKYAPIKVLGRYANPFPEYRHQTLFEFGFRRITELLSPSEMPAHASMLEAALPRFKPDFLASLSGHKMALTWLGQSCAVAQFVEGITVLTDPMFSNHVVSPHVGPQRLVPCPCLANEVPQPQAVLVSHDHQDHLDLAAAEELTKPGTTWVVPLGVARHLPASAEVVEMSWWDKIPLPNVDPKLGYEIACTPAMHWSGRALYDSNVSLWCSFLILRHGKPVFFHGGDSGYSPDLFKAISKVYGRGTSVAMVPCGAYIPRWHLRAQHMAPFESVATMQDMGANKLVGVHWGTFKMSEEPFTEPPKRLIEEAKVASLEEKVVAPQLGKTMFFDI